MGAKQESELSFHRYVEFSAPDKALDDKARILEALRGAADKLGAKVLDESSHKFEPQGVTALLLLSTSHLAIHTWPEYGMGQLDVLSCNKSTPVEPAIEHVMAALGGEVVKIRKAVDPWLFDGDESDVAKGSGVKPSDETPGHPFFRTYGLLTPFGDKIMPLFPKEAPDTYAELFCGNVEMLWCHPKRAKREVINDLDKDIVRLHRICQKITDADLAKLAKMDWTSAPGLFEILVKASTPAGDLAFLHRELYIRRFSKAGRSKPRYAEFSTGGTMQPIKRIVRCRARLQGVEISNRDYRKAIAKYDSKGTFWEIDPPYPEEQGYYPFKMPDLGEQAEHYQKLQGQAMVIIEGSRESLRPLIELKGWQEFKFRWPRKWHHTPKGPSKPWVFGSMFVNYDPPGKRSTKKSVEVHDWQHAEDVLDAIEKAVAKLRVEQIIPSTLADLDDDKLRSLERQLHEVYNETFQGNDKLTAGGQNREDLINAAVFVWRELTNRGQGLNLGAPMYREAERAGLVKADDLGARSTADINPGSPGELQPVDADDVLPSFGKPMILRAPAVSLVGSICTQNQTRADIDVLVHGPLSDELRRVIEFRIGRALPPELSQRVEFHNDGLGGPFTDSFPLYDLALVPSPRRRFVRMSADAALELFKQDDPTLLWPEKPGLRRAVVQLHTRGSTAHFDLRLKIDGFLVGWTMFAQRVDEVPDVETAAQARALYREYSAAKGNRFLKPVLAPSRLQVTSKKRQPVEWLTLDGEEFDEGDVGATSGKKGTIVAVGRPSAEWGLQLPQFHEYFLTGDEVWQGPIYMRLLVDSEDVDESGEGRMFWACWLSKTMLPSVLNEHSVERKHMPPLGHSAMPTTLMQVTPPEFRFWKAGTEQKARETRDALVAERFFTDANVRLVDGEFRRIVTKHYLFKLDDIDEPDDAVEQELAKSTDRVPLLKTKEEQYVLGIVLEPNDGESGAPLDPDSQGDIYSKDEVRQAAHRFMVEFRNVGLMHRALVNGRVEILESFIVPDGTGGFDIEDPDGKKQHVREGTWLLGLRVVDKVLWQKVKSGQLSGLSIGGSARRIEAGG